MLLGYLGKPMDVDHAKKIAHTTWLKHNGQEIGMTLPIGIAATLKSAGVPAQVQHGNIERLKYFISKNKPPVVLLRSSVKTWHYVVAIGYTDDKIIIANPGCGEREDIPIKDFLSAWRFTSDMSGNVMPSKSGLDPYFELVRMSGVSGETYIVPNYRNLL